jgi:hypothetical protein
VATQTEEYRAKAFEARNLVFFFLLVFGLNSIMWVLVGIFHLKMPTTLTDPVLPLWLLVAVPAVFGPTLAAFAMTGITEGKRGVRALWRRFWNRNLSLKWLLVTLLFFEALKLITILVARTIDGQDYPFVDLPSPLWMIIPLFLAAFVYSGLAEEFGWRGYVLPRFQAKWNALVSSIVLGLIWASWHIPAFFIPNLPLYQKDFWAWAPEVLLTSVLFTWIFNNTRGSVLAACLFHASMNSSVVALPTDASHWYFRGVLLVAVILIVIIFGPKDLVRQQPAEAT